MENERLCQLKELNMKTKELKCDRDTFGTCKRCSWFVTEEQLKAARNVAAKYLINGK